MIRDQGPNNSLGFGVTRGQIPEAGEREGADPESGYIARILHDHPLAKFVSTSVATIMAAGVAGAVVRGGGKRGLAYMARQAALSSDPRYANSIKGFREVRDILDEYEGVARKRGQRLIDIDDGGKTRIDDPSLDTTVNKHGFFYTEGEKERMRTLGMDPPAEWTLRNEVQQRLVRQARRLPYELPAAYITQRAVTDRLLGVDDERDKVNWRNPFDILGDFAQQSVKNIATSLVPFEVGTGVAKQGWRRAMVSGTDPSSSVSPLIKDLSVTLEGSLGLIGQETSDLLQKGVRYSQQSAGALSSAFQRGAGRTQPILETLDAIRRGNRVDPRDIPLFGDVMRSNTVFRERWREIGDEFDHTEAFLKGRKTFKRNGKVIEVDAVKATKRLTASRFQQTAQALTTLTGRSGDDLTEGSFRAESEQQAYRDIFFQKVRDAGVPDKTADLIRRSATFTLPTSINQKSHISRRFGMGAEAIYEGNRPDGTPGRWIDELYAHIRNIEGADKFGDPTFLNRMIKASDREFLLDNLGRDKRIRTQWDHLMKNFIVPETRRSLGYKRAPYEEFRGAMSGDAGEFLVRRSAERLGIPLQTAGNPRHTSQLRAEIRRHGFDPSNKHQLRAFLIEKGDISKPWNPKGLNFLGMQSLSVQEALDRRLIQDRDEVSGQVDNLAEQIKRSDWDPNVLNRLKVGGVYKTATGNIIDFNPLQRAASTFAGRLNTELQVPFLHIKPLQMIGFKQRADIANSPVIQYQAGYRSQPFTGLSESDDTAGYLWFKGAGSKGRAARLSMDERGQARGEWLQGMFRPMDTSAGTLAGLNIRLAAGQDQGRVADRPRGWFARTFNIDENQPSSIPQAIRRFRNRRNDLGFVGTAANYLRQRDFTDQRRSTQALETIENQLRNTGVIGFRAAEVAQGNRSRFLSSLFRWGDVDVFDPDSKTMLRAVHSMADEGADAAGIVDEQAAGILTRAQRNILGKWKRVQEPRVLDDTLPQAMSTVGLSRRVDALRLDMMRYLGIREGLRGSLDEFNNFMRNAHGELRGMQKSGLINQQELAEARAALGSMQIGFLSMRRYTTEETEQALASRILGEIYSTDPGIARQYDDLRDVIQEAGEFRTMGGGPLRRGILRRVKQRYGIADQEFPGLEYNPYSQAQSSVLVPTFSTAFARNPGRATASALGFGTWNDPDSFSGAGIAMSHIMNRMNRPLQGFGIGLDPSQYNGPMHMLGKGFFLQRAVPVAAAGATFMAVDRTAGAYTTPRDEDGDRVYRPLVVGALGEGVVRAQVGLAGALPGGQTAEEKDYELRQGEVAVRRGRWWPLGNTPWRGGKVQYYRPSWYRRMNSGYQYGEQGWDSPMEKLAFGYDFSPLRPFDPYRYEREHYNDRPYPVTGEYFTGPWGPMTGVLNQTVGRILKPRQMMHEEEVNYNLSRYQPFGARGMAAPATARPVSGEPTIGAAIGLVPGGVAGGGQNNAYMAASNTPFNATGSRAARNSVFAGNARYSDAVGLPAGYNAPMEYPFQLAGSNNPYDIANPRRPANPMLAAEPISPGSIGYQASEFGYLMQEWSGIYGFASGAVRSGLGFGNQDLMPQRPVLASPGAAYGTSRQFWDLNLGGLGDFPTPLEGDYANLEISEVVRRFIPRPRKPNEINPIENQLGRENPWLPGNEYFKNFKWGDPYTLVPEGEMRLPGQGYERFNELHSDETGRYGVLDQFKILADIAPYSEQFRMIASRARQIDPALWEQTMARVETMKQNNEFRDYTYKYSSPEEQGMSDLEFGFKSLGERIAHANTFANTKFLPHATAVEDWERNDVYGASFPQWQNPIQDFLMPSIYRATTRNPLSAAIGLGAIGRLFGATPQAKTIGGLIGSAVGFTAGLARGGAEAVSGERYLPPARRQELALEEYTDILQYVKSSRGLQQAQMAGNQGLAAQFKKQMQSTMYGADIYEGTPGELERAIPKRKREHFRAMLQAPPQERERILSTAGRLERRIYQGAWGMRVEKRPELEDYFQKHELPDDSWEGWDPRVSMDLVKIKMGQAQGLNMSQMGYYPQQLAEANLINPSYPDFSERTRGNVRAQLEQLISARGLSGSVREINTPYPGTRADVSYGAY